MSSLVIEDIEEVRRREGIVDRELRTDIGRLKPGQSVKLSIATGPHGYETVTVRLTSIRASVLRGRLVKKPKASALRELDAGSLLTFRTSNVHSIVGRNNSSACMTQMASNPHRNDILREARLEAERECDCAASLTFESSFGRNRKNSS